MGTATVQAGTGCLPHHSPSRAGEALTRPETTRPPSHRAVLEQGPHGVGGAVAQQGFPLQKLV
ncbi:hypothetical protein ABTP29_17785, partial [Acinetobacter baumannii]